MKAYTLGAISFALTILMTTVVVSTWTTGVTTGQYLYAAFIAAVLALITYLIIKQ